MLTETGLTTSETAALSFLSASNAMRTRYAHQVTLVVLDRLIKQAHEERGHQGPLEDWLSDFEKESPTAAFWILIRRYQILIFMFIRSHRENQFKLMLDTLRMLAPLFFAMDHQNYARWIPAFIGDLENLPASIEKEFDDGKWVISRGIRRFSSIPTDQAHEQANKRVKGVGGVIGLTENPCMLERWVLTGSEISRMVEQFEDVEDLEDFADLLPHHEEGQTSQQRFRRHVTDLVDVLMNKGNPFEEHSEDLVTLDNKVCESKTASDSVHLIECKGKEQYNDFRKLVLESGSVLLAAPIKRNNFELYHEKKKVKISVLKNKVKHFKDQAELYGKTALILESRGGDLNEFFRHESSSYPPALSCNGQMNSCTKSDLLACILEADIEMEIVTPDVFDAIIIDGGTLIHSLPGTRGVMQKNW